VLHLHASTFTGEQEPEAEQIDTELHELPAMDEDWIVEEGERERLIPSDEEIAEGLGDWTSAEMEMDAAGAYYGAPN
jgi:hypothetical protein